MSDQFGHRPPLRTGIVIYVGACAACALAPRSRPSSHFRLVQGLSDVVAIVIARAVVWDLFDGLAMAGFCPLWHSWAGWCRFLPPLPVGQLLSFTDWRGVSPDGSGCAAGSGTRPLTGDSFFVPPAPGRHLHCVPLHSRAARG